MSKLLYRIFDTAMIAATSALLALCARDFINGYRSTHTTTNQTVSVTPEVEPAVILKAPTVQVSEYPKVEPELPQQFMPQGIATNVTDVMEEIRIQDQLLLWLNQLDK